MNAYECDDCLVPVPAVEEHLLNGGMVVRYCAKCAPTWRPYAVNIRPLAS